MIGTTEIAQIRLARYYLAKLRMVETSFKWGHEHSADALAQFDQEWAQIKRWRDWSAEHAFEHDAIADLCMEFPQAGMELFLLRQHPYERLEWLEAGLEAARRLGNKKAEMVLVYLLGWTNSRISLMESAQHYTDKAYKLARELNEPSILCKVLIVQGGIYYSQDEYERSKACHTQALTLATELGAEHDRGLAYNGLGNVAFSQNNYEQAYDYYRRFQDISEAIGLSTGICMALRNLSMVTKHLGDLDAATAYAEQCIALCRSIGYQSCLAESLAELATIASDRDELYPALDLYQQSLELARLITHRSDEAYVLYRLGCLHLQLGNIVESQKLLEDAAALSKDIGERWFAALSLMNLASLFRANGDVVRACQLLSEGWEFAAEIESSAIRAKYLVEAALVWLDQGRVEQAAIWAGLLEQHVDKLRAEECRRYNQLRQTVEEKLDAETYASATATGKSLELDKVITGIMEEITSGQLQVAHRQNP